ncbi:MAG: ABC transporter ATP-binding protein [Aestuariivita sp.]|nr:ABC transporter ATP-binding protein [Aestuariivita sp.]
MSEDILRLINLSKSYNLGKPSEIHVLKDVSIAICSGEVVALVAPSGAGKSTLLHIAGLLDTPDKGDVFINDHSMNNLSDHSRTAVRRTDIGFVYQFHHLLPEFSAVENVSLPQRAMGRGHADAHERAVSLLGRVGLSDRVHNRPAELSGGEQQRVAFCRALANEPRVLLADEPTGNLDPASAEHVFDILLELVTDTGMAAMIATHNVELACRMNRIIRLENGQLT